MKTTTILNRVKRAASRGVTLIEILIVLAIVGLIAGGVAVVAIPKYAEAQKNDPYPRFRSLLVEQRHATIDELDGIDAEIAEQIDAAEAFAMSSPPPETAEVKRDVYAYELA